MNTARARLLAQFGTLAAASAAQVIALAILGFVLAAILSVEDYGVTRVISAYFVVLVMAAHFCLHDAAANALGASSAREYQNDIYATAVIGVVMTSLLVSGLLLSVTHFIRPWNNELTNAMLVSALLLPPLALTILCNSALQACGQIRALAYNVTLAGVVPLLLLASASLIYGLDGWLYGRDIVQFILLASVCASLKRVLSFGRVTAPIAANLFHFAKIQWVSGIASMVMQSADIIAMERAGVPLAEIGSYGLAALIARSAGVFPAALGRVYFHRISEDVRTANCSRREANRLLVLATLMGLGLAGAVLLFGPPLIGVALGADYSLSQKLIPVMSLGIVANSIWGALSIINIATKKPGHAAAISITGLGTACVALAIMIPLFHVEGAAWAMNIALLSGIAIGLALYRKTGT